MSMLLRVRDRLKKWRLVAHFGSICKVTIIYRDWWGNRRFFLGEMRRKNVKIGVRVMVLLARNGDDGCAAPHHSFVRCSGLTS